MAYWIQEFGGNGQNRYNFRFYHCDYETDITKLPTNTADGKSKETMKLVVQRHIMEISVYV